ncbi:MAG: portal protein [bacterium]
MANKEIKKGTIYQQLNSMLNLDGFGFDDQQPSTTGSQKQQKILIKGNSPEEIHRKGLELEQKRAIQDKFSRTTDRGFQKALQYEAARLPAYIDYEGMEFYPIISSALDLFMEECTTIGINGKMLNIYSNKERIKLILEEFFYDVVNVNINLPFWTRNLVKYGDNFVLMYGEGKKGITHVKQMVNYEIERFERIQNGKPIVKFKERMTGDEFNTFEIAHFRLLGDDKYLPYGSSILNKIRRVFRQLVMAEDAMLTYRIIRAGEKKVFKIDVGNMDEDDIEEYIYKVATKFKKMAAVNPNDGQIDYRFNILGNDEDYFLPVRNANTQTGIETLPGATNLDAIQDIEYLRDNLFIGLGVPKPFLSFQDAAGGGKNMAQFDIRFAKKINRIQQAMIQELNKMAMIHLYLMGYSGEDLSDFTLTLTNPSVQQEMLKSELLREKAQTYTELTRGEGGIAAMSHTMAQRLVFNMTDREIVENFKQQKMEKIVMQELADAPAKIKRTGLFGDIDKKYGVIADDEPSPEGAAPEGMEGAAPEGEAPEGMGGAAAGAPPAGDIPAPGGGEGGMPMMETEEFNDYVSKMIYNNNASNNQTTIDTRRKIINENNKINENLNSNAQNMVNEIDELIKKGNTINKLNTTKFGEGIDFEDIGDLELDDDETNQ